MFGLGIYIYAGEDLPESETTAAVTEQVKQPAELIELKKGSDNWTLVINYINSNKSLGADKIMQQLSRKYKFTPAIKKEINSLWNQ